MILRSLMKHVKDQNWSAVFLDFLIVVFGVFFGAQVASWNVERQNRILFQEALSRAESEFHTNLHELENTRSLAKKSLPVVQAALNVLRECRTDEASKKIVEKALGPVRKLVVFEFSTTALEQLINSSDFLPFQNNEMRDGLLGLYNSSRSGSDGSRLIALDIHHDPIGWEAILHKDSLTYANTDEVFAAITSGVLPTPDVVRKRTLAITMEEACTNPVLLSELYTWEDNAYYQITVGRLYKERLNKIGQQLGFSLSE